MRRMYILPAREGVLRTRVRTSATEGPFDRPMKNSVLAGPVHGILWLKTTNVGGMSQVATWWW